jgi:hypothetical protein
MQVPGTLGFKRATAGQCEQRWWRRARHQSAYNRGQLVWSSTYSYWSGGQCPRAALAKQTFSWVASQATEGSECTGQRRPRDWLDRSGHPLRQGSDRRQTASALSAPLREMAPVGGSHQPVWNRMQQRHASEGQATLRGQSRRSRRGGDRDGERRLSRLQWHNQSTCGPVKP